MKVTVIIPMYNAEKTLHLPLESLAKQTLKDFEVIIIDDGSTDKSVEIASKYYDRIPNLTILRTHNYGSGHARNVGLDHATGEYIKFLDADDELAESTTLEMLYSVATKYDIDTLVGKYYTHIGPINLRAFYKTLGRPQSEMIDLEQNKSYPFQEMPGVGDKFFKREFIGDIRFSERKWEDLAFVPPLLASSKRLYFLDEVIYNYNFSLKNTSITGCLFASSIFDFFDDYKDLVANFALRGLYDQYQEEILGMLSLHGHFDSTMVPYWLNLPYKKKKDLLKLFITKLEMLYPEFRNDPLTKAYYDNQTLFKSMFGIADALAKRSTLETGYDTVNADIKSFLEDTPVLQRRNPVAK